MNPRLRIFAIVFAALFWLAVAKACFGYDPDAGMVAARMLGEKRYLAFKINNRVESAAVFSFEGHRYIYHPAFGSARMPDGNYSALDYFPGCMWVPVLCVPRTANLENACLPRAIAQAKATGGKVRLEYRFDPRTMQPWNHASVVPR